MTVKFILRGKKGIYRSLIEEQYSFSGLLDFTCQMIYHTARQTDYSLGVPYPSMQMVSCPLNLSQSTLDLHSSLTCNSALEDFQPQHNSILDQEAATISRACISTLLSYPAIFIMWQCLMQLDGRTPKADAS